MTKIIGTIDVENTLGEGPVWDDRANRLWWTDIHARQLYHWDWETRATGVVDLPHRLGSFALTNEKGTLLCAFAAGFALYRVETGDLEWLHKVEPDYRGIRMNDGRMDRAGRFWAGSMVENDQLTLGATGSLYSLDQHNQLSTHFDGVRISNSTCFSPDGKTLYFADTPTKRIDCFDLAADGSLGERRTFVEVVGEGVPDGSDIDADGCLWNAEWGGWQLTCYRPDGAIKEQVKLPISRPTCPVFGGPDLDHIFVTSSRLELEDADFAKEPDAGKILILHSNVKGLPAPRFQMDLKS